MHASTNVINAHVGYYILASICSIAKEKIKIFLIGIFTQSLSPSLYHLLVISFSTWYQNPNIISR